MYVLQVAGNFSAENYIDAERRCADEERQGNRKRVVTEALLSKRTPDDCVENEEANLCGGVCG